MADIIGTKSVEPEYDFGERQHQFDADIYDDSSGDSAKWYVIHTYSGHENKVKINIEKIVESKNMTDQVIKVLVPTEEYLDKDRDGNRKVKTRKKFPGYVLVKMIVNNQSWYIVRNTQGVTGFVGHGTDPVPLTKDEVRRMGIDKVVVVLDINVGDRIKVISGAFEGFSGVVEEVNPERETLRARVEMFGRETPVELDYDLIDKF